MSQQSIADLARITHISTFDDVSRCVALATASGIISVDTETTGFHWALGHIPFMLQVSPSLGEIFVTDEPLFAVDLLGKLDIHFQGYWLFHNAIFDLHMMREGFQFYPQGGYLKMKLADSMIAHRVLYPGEDADLKKCSQAFCEELEVDLLQKEVKDFLKKEDKQRKKLGQPKVTYADVPRDLMLRYACQDVYLTHKVWAALQADAVSHPVYQRDMRIMALVCEMERVGIPVDRDTLRTLIKASTDNLQDAVEKWREEAGEVNPNSRPQLQDLFYTELGEEVVHTTKAGRPAVTEEAASRFVHRPEANAITEYQRWSTASKKLIEIDTFVDKFDYLHTSLKASAARTGRFSSSNPALQNLPNPNPEKPWTYARSVIAPHKGYSLLFGDQSNVELRLAAHVMQDQNWIQAFIDGIDRHTLTATQLFGVPLAQVTKDQRGLAKTYNFAILYCAGVKTLASNLQYGGMVSPVPLDVAISLLLLIRERMLESWQKQVALPPEEMHEDDVYLELANLFYRKYHEENPKVKELSSQLDRKARKDGYIDDVFGARLTVPEKKTFAAINTLIQGSAASLTKLCMLRIYDKMETLCLEQGLMLWDDLSMIMQIHDELVFHILEGYEETFVRYISHTICDWPHLSVPIIWDWKVSPSSEGLTWATKRKLVLS